MADLTDYALARPAQARVDLALDRLQLWMAALAALLISLTLGAVLGGRLAGETAPGWLLTMPRLTAAGAVLTGQLGALAGYYATWRILRGQTEYEASGDLKKELLSVPSHLSVVGGRAGCRVGCRQWGALGVFALAVVCFALLALLGYPEKSSAQARGSGPGGSVSTPVAVTPTPTRSSATPTPTGVHSPTVAPTPTPTPRIAFRVSPTATTQDCLTLGDPLPPVTVTLDNTGSSVAVGWQLTVQETLYTGTKWAAASASGGSVPAGKLATVTLTPTSGPSGVCHTSYSTTYHATVRLTSGGTSSFTVADTITPYPILR